MARVECGVRGVEVAGIKSREGDDPFVGTAFHDREGLDLRRSGAPLNERKQVPRQGEALAACCEQRALVLDVVERDREAMDGERVVALETESDAIAMVDVDIARIQLVEDTLPVAPGLRVAESQRGAPRRVR